MKNNTNPTPKQRRIVELSTIRIIVEEEAESGPENLADRIKAHIEAAVKDGTLKPIEMREAMFIAAIAVVVGPYGIEFANAMPEESYYLSAADDEPAPAGQ